MNDQIYIAKNTIVALVSTASLMIGFAGPARAQGITVKAVKGDLDKNQADEALWKDTKAETIAMMAQPMTMPRPVKTTTPEINVRAIHNGTLAAFQIRWKDPEPNEGGKLGTFSDAVAIQFPVKEGDPPAVFMGSKDQPVQIIHWRAQFQVDAEKGVRKISDHYPNQTTDIYPYEYKAVNAEGKDKNYKEEWRQTYQHAVAAGNPQSAAKVNGIDEIRAEGFSTSAVVAGSKATAHGIWKDGEWVVTITRPMKQTDALTFAAGGSTSIAFAVWQGGKDEVAGRKSLTMAWTPLTFEKQ